MSNWDEEFARRNAEIAHDLEHLSGLVDAYVAKAELLESYLRRVLELVARNGGHQWPEDQAMLRGARAVLRGDK